MLKVKHIEFVVETGNGAKELCKEALRNKLFVEGWELVNNLIDCIVSKPTKRYRGRHYYFASGVRYKGKLIGICLIKGNWISLFINEKFRCKGLASDLIEVLIDIKKINTFPLIAGVGIAGSSNSGKNTLSLKYIKPLL